MTTLKYFKSFETYERPFVPIDEVSFGETCSLPTFYVGRFEGDDQLHEFAKYAVTRCEQRVFELAEPSIAGRDFYFAVRNTDESPIDWSPTSYVDTEGLEEYYRGTVGESRDRGIAHRFERIVAFSEDYSGKESTIATEDGGAHTDSMSLLKLGEELVANNKYRDAVMCMDGVIREEPNNAMALALKSSALLEEYFITEAGSGRERLLDDALTCSLRSLDIQPRNSSFLANTGIIHFVRGQHEESVACLESAIEVDPSNVFALFNRGAVLYNLGRYEAAVESLEMAASLDDEEARQVLDDARSRRWKPLRPGS